MEWCILEHPARLYLEYRFEMLTETALEVLRCLSRQELESLQMRSRLLRNLSDRYAGDLPLRSIYGVSVRSLSVHAY